MSRKRHGIPGSLPETHLPEEVEKSSNGLPAHVTEDSEFLLGDEVGVTDPKDGGLNFN